MSTQNIAATQDKDIRHDPMIAGMLERVPEKVAATFSDEQLFSLKAALGAHRGHRHPFDVRGSFGLGRWRWYYVFLAGRNQRRSLRLEGRCNRLAVAIFWTIFLLLALLGGLALLALLKWGFGIDLLAGGLEQAPSALLAGGGRFSLLPAGGGS